VGVSSCFNQQFSLNFDQVVKMFPENVVKGGGGGGGGGVKQFSGLA
jgi:hypothetical protein